MTPTEYAQEAFQRRHDRAVRNAWGYPLELPSKRRNWLFIFCVAGAAVGTVLGLVWR